MISPVTPPIPRLARALPLAVTRVAVISLPPIQIVYIHAAGATFAWRPDRRVEKIDELFDDTIEDPERV